MVNYAGYDLAGLLCFIGILILIGIFCLCVHDKKELTELDLLEKRRDGLIDQMNFYQKQNLQDSASYHTTNYELKEIQLKIDKVKQDIFCVGHG